jgi:hypothetical protein
MYHVENSRVVISTFLPVIGSSSNILRAYPNNIKNKSVYTNASVCWYCVNLNIYNIKLDFKFNCIKFYY